MKPAAIQVLKKLRSSKSKGVTHWDFPSGFALRSRISDLRGSGCEIKTNLEKNQANTGRHARYILIKEGK